MYVTFGIKTKNSFYPLRYKSNLHRKNKRLDTSQFDYLLYLCSRNTTTFFTY